MDKRQVKTRLRIYDGFKHLLTEKNYEDISVNEILDISNVSRSAFYAHFEGKDDLLSKLSDLIFEEVFSYQNATENNAQTYDYSYIIWGIFSNFNKQKELVSAVFRSTGSSIFTTSLRRKIWPLFESAIRHREFYVEGVPERLQAHQLTQCLISLLEHYVSKQNAYSPEQMRDIFYKLYK